MNTPETKNIHEIKPHNTNPTEQDVVEVLKLFAEAEITSIERFPTGLAHFVYDIKTRGGLNVVARLTKPENRESLEAGLYWYNLLEPKGIPLPKIYKHNTKDAKFPYIIMERLAGTDLGNVYPTLSDIDKKTIAQDIASIQVSVASLPKAKGFGFAKSYESELLPQWTDVIKQLLERSRNRIKKAGLVDSTHVDRVEEKIPNYTDYFSKVEPECFLDDTTTKNVIVNNGKLTGIVDIDGVCFGDKLLPIALANTSLLNSGYDPSYIKYWVHALSITEEQKEVIKFYTALYAVDFMSEGGQKFNKESVSPINEERVKRLIVILEDSLS